MRERFLVALLVVILAAAPVCAAKASLCGHVRVGHASRCCCGHGHECHCPQRHKDSTTPEQRRATPEAVVNADLVAGAVVPPVGDPLVPIVLEPAGSPSPQVVGEIYLADRSLRC